MRQLVISALALAACGAQAQTVPPANYDESKVGSYTLPDPLTLRNGRAVKDARAWTRKRRPELMRIYEQQVFGKTVAPKAKPLVEVVEAAGTALEGKAVRKQSRIWFAGKKEGPKADVLVYLPAKAAGPVPIFVGLSFGNATAPADPAVAPGESWRGDGAGRGRRGEAGDRARFPTTSRSSRATQVGPVRALRPPGFRPGKEPAADEWGGATTARRCCASRPRQLQAERAGPGPVAGGRARVAGSDCTSSGYVASAEEDRWADPRGEFLAAVSAGRVYELLGKKGLGTDGMPGIHQPIMNTVGYHIRAGKHDVTAYDWDQYLAFAEKHFGK
jgi:hypothetical protein